MEKNQIGIKFKSDLRTSKINELCLYCFYYVEEQYEIEQFIKSRRVKLLFFLRSKVETAGPIMMTMMIYYINNNNNTAANTFIWRDRYSLSCPPAKLGDSMWLYSSVDTPGYMEE